MRVMRSASVPFSQRQYSRIYGDHREHPENVDREQIRSRNVKLLFEPAGRARALIRAVSAGFRWNPRQEASSLTETSPKSRSKAGQGGNG